jgi:N-formylglutamate deformylase
VYPVSRLVVDPERFLDDESEPMSERGMGVVYTKTSAGKPLRSKPEDFDRGQLIDRFYRPHHHKLLLASDAELKMQGSCLIVDCHSFPSRPLPYEQDQNSNRPDICIGTDEYHTPAWLSKLITRLFIEQGYRVELNRPFSGTIVPSPCFRVNAAVTSVMVELNRHLYMNELNGEKSSAFDTVKGHLQMILQKLRMEYSRRL